MNRRRFLTGLAGIIAAAQAPAFLSPDVLMKIRPIGENWIDFVLGPTQVMDFDLANGVVGPVTVTSRWMNVPVLLNKPRAVWIDEPFVAPIFGSVLIDMLNLPPGGIKQAIAEEKRRLGSAWCMADDLS